jgi:ATP-dependent Clp protease ATP-binding subunit ClpC
MLPIRLIKFWYLDSIPFFLRAHQHAVLFLEEDMAVGLMFKLLFTPLFHDPSFTGRILSFFFRLSRIFMGLSAIVGVSLLTLLLGILWLGAPLFLILSLFTPYPIIATFFAAVIFFGMGLFFHKNMAYPGKSLKHVNGLNDIWSAAKLKQPQVSWGQLSQTQEVKELLSLLEINARFIEMDVAITDSILQKALDLAKANKAQYLTPGYFWVGMLESMPNIENGLLKLNLRVKDFEEALAFLEYKRNNWRKIYVWDEDFSVKHLKGVNRGWLGAPTPNLDAASRDITKEAATFGFPNFVGRKGVVEEVVNVLSQPGERNVLIVGDAGAGRTTLVHSLAAKIVAGDAPPALAVKRLVELDLTRMLSSASTQGDLAAKVKGIFDEVQYMQDIIIFVDEIQTMGMGEAATNLNLYSLMLPYLESNQFQFIAVTDQGNYAKIIEKNGSFARLFHKVELKPATVEETVEILKEEAVNLARYKGIFMTYLALKQLASFSEKLIHDKVLPDSALSVLKEAQVVAADKLITSEVIKKTLEKRVNVPIVEIDAGKKEELLNLEQIIHSQMIDQEEAVKKVADALRRSATALKEQDRPIGSFLFVGPTGVGKTELAKTLAKVFFKNEGAYISFDMSEYQTPEAVNRLIGTTDTPGELTEAIKNKPYALLLLDEFEKANANILTLFLQVLEEGRLTDASGKHVSFANTIIIATSNAASLTIAQGLEKGLTVAQLDQTVKDELLKVYKPELVNRFDEVVIFKPLSSADLAKIVTIKLESVKKLLSEQGYLIEFSPSLIAELAKKGFDPVLGARPLRRLIQDSVESKLSRFILENRLVRGETFVADVELLS